MTRPCKPLTLCVLAIFCGLLTRAQRYAISESSSDIKGPKHEIVHCADSGFITITYPFIDGKDKDPVTVTRFDAKLSQQYSNPIKDLLHEHYRGVVYGSGGLFLLTSNKDGNVKSYSVDEKTGAPTGSAVSLFTMNAKEEDAEFISGNSADNKLHYLIVQENQKNAKGKILQGVLMDRRGSKMMSFSYTTPEAQEAVKHIDAVLSNDGILDLVYSAAVKPAKDDNTLFKYTIVQVDLRGRPAAIPLTDLPAGDFQNISWSINRHALVCFTGFLSLKRNTGFTTVVSGTFDQIKKKLGGLQQSNVSSLLAKQKQPDFVKELTANGLPANLSLIKALNLVDGSRALVLEDTTTNMATFHVRGNNYIVKLDPNNTPQWITLVSKNQKEQDITLAIGTAVMGDDMGNINLFFYDNKDNTDAAAASPKEVDGDDNTDNFMATITITPDGLMNKQMLRQVNPHYRIMLAQSVTNSNEVYFLAVKAKKADTEQQILNHAKFVLGQMSVGYISTMLSSNP